jgi:tetratricopeptide (TPR) repeat protein
MKLFPGAPNVYLLHGVAAMELSRNREAISSLQRGIGLAEDNIPLEVQFYSMLGEVYRNDNNNVMSDAMFRKALELDSENLYVLNNYSYYLSLREEELETALEMSKKCVVQEPNNPTYLDTYAWILFKLERIEEAREYIERAIGNSGSNSSEIVDHYGDILMKFGEMKEALTQWRKARELGKESVELENKIKTTERRLLERE